MALFYLAIVLIFQLERLPFLFIKKLKGMIEMYFTDTPELRKLEWEMKQKPNFDRRNDEENEDSQFIDNRKSDANRNTKDGG